MRKFIKIFYLDLLRKIIFKILFLSTRNLRKKTFDKNNVKNILVFGLNRIGDNALSIPAFRAIRENFPSAKISIISNGYVKEILEIDGSFDEILYFRRANIFIKIKTISRLLRGNWDLGVDLTCDYTFLPSFLLFVSAAKFRVGYNIKERGFLFNRAVLWQVAKKHFVERLSDILKEIDISVSDNRARIEVPVSSKENIKGFLNSNNISEKDFIVGIHPGGHYPSQRWPMERFAEVSDRIIKKYNAKIVVMGTFKEKQMIGSVVSSKNKNKITAYNFSIADLLGLINSCKIFICNNSGLLHLATALDVPTISTMGPTDSALWWPQGDFNIVLKKDLACLGCKNAVCATHECLDLITVDDMMNAVDIQVQRFGLDI